MGNASSFLKGSEPCSHEKRTKLDRSNETSISCRRSNNVLIRFQRTGDKEAVASRSSVTNLGLLGKVMTCHLGGTDVRELAGGGITDGRIRKEIGRRPGRGRSGGSYPF